MDFYKRDREIFQYLLDDTYKNLDDTAHKNIWMGASIEDKKTADERIPVLLQIPAKVRWLSVEPMLEGINLGNYLYQVRERFYIKGVDWVVVGAESGPKRRECKIKWIESIIEQCRSANVPVFVKQIHLNGKLEKDITKFPKHLQIREYPK